MSETQATILIAEDEQLVRLVAVEMLEDAGFTVIEAPDGDKGLQILQSTPSVALLISDIKMPGLNGYQLAEAGLELNPQLRVILVTGYADKDIPDALRRDTVRILHKPFDFERLTKLARDLLAT